MTCSEPTCSELNFCSYNGKCTSNQTCFCNDGFFENDCSKASCSKVNDCSGSGICVGPNQCQCLKGYEGESCEKKIQENKFSPEFLSNNTYEITIDEAVEINSILLRIIAIDYDDGSNGLVSYAINQIFDNKYFKINYSTGTIKLVQNLLTTKAKLLVIEVKAYDDGFPSKSSTQKINFNVRRISCDDTINKTISNVELNDWRMGQFITSLRPNDIFKRNVSYSIKGDNYNDKVRSSLEVSPLTGIVLISNKLPIGNFIIYAMAIEYINNSSTCLNEFSFNLIVKSDEYVDPFATTTTTTTSTTSTETTSTTSTETTSTTSTTTTPTTTIITTMIIAYYYLNY